MQQAGQKDTRFGTLSVTGEKSESSVAVCHGLTQSPSGTPKNTWWLVNKRSASPLCSLFFLDSCVTTCHFSLFEPYERRTTPLVTEVRDSDGAPRLQFFMAAAYVQFFRYNNIYIRQERKSNIKGAMMMRKRGTETLPLATPPRN